MRRLILGLWVLCCVAGEGWGSALREGMPVVAGLYLGMPIKEAMALSKQRLELQLQHEEEGYYGFVQLSGKGWRGFSRLREQSLPDDLTLQADRSGKVVAVWMSSSLFRRLFPQVEGLVLESFMAQFAAEHHLPPWSFGGGRWRGYGWYAFEQPRFYTLKVDTGLRFWMDAQIPESADKQ
ncbi:MAG: hypothetical protein HQM04_01720 [Magnetococcales bacterium]|nr:hypothetical protein [Magnetococcales bacterium]MBF0113738.1 hypothetical protein [Magnetococcales bacterium]